MRKPFISVQIVLEGPGGHLFFGGCRFLEKDKLEMANLSSNFVAKVVSHWMLELCSILENSCK